MSDATTNETEAAPVARPAPKRPLWLTVMVGFAGLVVLGNLAAFLYATSLPESWEVTESVKIDAPPAAVRPLVATPGRWPDWSAFSTARDATLLTTTAGPDAGEGAQLRWTGKLFGTGELTLTEATETEVTYEIVMHGQPFSDGGTLTLMETDGGGTEVTWTDGGPLGDTMSRLFGSVIRDGIARDFRFGLGRLKELAEEDAPSGEREAEAGSSVGPADE